MSFSASLCLRSASPASKALRKSASNLERLIGIYVTRGLSVQGEDIAQFVLRSSHPDGSLIVSIAGAMNMQIQNHNSIIFNARPHQACSAELQRSRVSGCNQTNDGRVRSLICGGDEDGLNAGGILRITLVHDNSFYMAVNPKGSSLICRKRARIITSDALFPSLSQISDFKRSLRSHVCRELDS